MIKGLLEKGYLKVQEGKYSPVCGNMSFEIFKFLDPESIAITLTSSDCNGNSVSVPVIEAVMDDFIRNNIVELTWK